MRMREESETVLTFLLLLLPCLTRTLGERLGAMEQREMRRRGGINKDRRRRRGVRIKKYNCYF
jgi:hypothetical protein